MIGTIIIQSSKVSKQYEFEDTIARILLEIQIQPPSKQELGHRISKQRFESLNRRHQELANYFVIEIAKGYVYTTKPTCAHCDRIERGYIATIRV